MLNRYDKKFVFAGYGGYGPGAVSKKIAFCYIPPPPRLQFVQIAAQWRKKEWIILLYVAFCLRDRKKPEGGPCSDLIQLIEEVFIVHSTLVWAALHTPSPRTDWSTLTYKFWTIRVPMWLKFSIMRTNGRCWIFRADIEAVPGQRIVLAWLYTNYFN